MQLLQPLLSGYLRRSRWCPLNRGFIVLNWKILGYFSLHFRWVIHRPVKIALGATRIFYPFILFFQKAYLTLASHQCGPGSNPVVDAIMWVKFVVGFLLCTKRFLSEYFGSPLFFKTNTFKFQFDLERTDMFQRVLNNSQVFVGKQITPKKMAPVVETLDSAIHRINPYIQRKSTVWKQEISHC